MKQISAKIIADSTNPFGNRITTMLLTYPRFLLAEFNTHRMFSRNSASSRAIPFEKMVREVEDDPFIPIAWQKQHKGMQGNEYLNPNADEGLIIREWLSARDNAVEIAKSLADENVTKQLCNRLLEPFMWTTTLVTATEWENFFYLRCPLYRVVGKKGEPFDSNFDFRSRKDLENKLGTPDIVAKARESKTDENIAWLSLNESQAEIHMQALAEAMWDAMHESTPKVLKDGEYHLPFSGDNKAFSYLDVTSKIQICIARCARLSYLNHEGEINYAKDIELYNRLLKEGHASPMEHVAEWKYDDEWYANFKGWQSHRNKLGL